MYIPIFSMSLTTRRNGKLRLAMRLDLMPNFMA